MTTKLRKLFFALAIIFAFSAASFAQAPKGTLPNHQAAISWTNPSDPPGTTITGSNVYRCPGACTSTTGTFTALNSTAISGTSYTDTAVVANTQYSWCVTNLVTLSTGPFETACSNVATATIPKDAAGAPTLNAPVTQ